MSRAYEIVRYLGMPFAQTHPDRLATMARLFGMNPTPIHNARVLEIGCCDGGNLIPMAVALPGTEFIGIDLTAPDIEKANQTVAELGLTNIHFHAMDLTTLPGPFGQFDYIMAHGVYSWVPPFVREKLPAVVKASLAPNGVAYVSYNTLPGGHLRVMLREMMLFHTRGCTDAADTLARARQLLEFIAATSSRNDEYQAFITKEIGLMFSRPDYGLFHDELEECYNPVYFHEFVSHAARCGLQYVSEANYFDMRPEAMIPADSKVFQDVSGDPLLREQYIDFARCRRFRQTLLCHQEIPLSRDVQFESMRALYFSSPARQVTPSEPQEEGAEEFHGPHNAKVKTAHRRVLEIMHQLVDVWPDSIPFRDVCSDEADSGTTCEILHALLGSGLIEVRTAPPPGMTLIAGERPVASPLARWQAARGTPLTSLRHITIATDGDLERRLISMLDGTRTRANLAAELASLFSADKSTEDLLTELDTTLKSLGRLSLLTA